MTSKALWKRQVSPTGAPFCCTILWIYRLFAILPPYIGETNEFNEKRAWLETEQFITVAMVAECLELIKYPK